MPDHATLQIEGRIATLTLHRPDARNALSLDLLESLRARIKELATKTEVSVCILAGEGKSFCAGMDLKAVLDEPGAPQKLLSNIAEASLELRALHCVTIAHVQGAAIGGGCGLMCLCDLSITHPEAKIGYPEVDLGVCPAVVAPWLMLRVGPGLARRVLLEGGTMSGERAHQLGLATALADRGDLESAVRGAADRLAAAGPNALRATKAWMNELQPLDLPEKVRRGAVISAEVVTSEEARASLRKAFAAR
ncbi:MAG: enoyl-CoA hydratase/isomerase family protein [Planctomycetota bacterium]|nr:enoyl-CoA hydratase/isomerase family protein [Planctomycetota bacterium]